MKRSELSLMMKANFGNEEAQRELVDIYEKKIRANNTWFAVLAILFVVGLYHQFSGGILYIFAVAYVLGNRICLRNQLKRITQIGEKHALL